MEFKARKCDNVNRKVIVVGNSGVGKTCLIWKFISTDDSLDKLCKPPAPTVGTC